MGLLEGRRGVAETHPLPSPPLEGEGVNSRGFGRLLQPRVPELLALRQVALGHRLRQLAHAQDGALALGDGDRAARVEQVEAVRGLHHLLVGGQRQVEFDQAQRSEAPTSDLQSLMRISYAVFCLKKKTINESPLNV